MPQAAYVKYCPRCDKPWISYISEEDAMRLMLEHADKAHPDYYIEMELGEKDV